MWFPYCKPPLPPITSTQISQNRWILENPRKTYEILEDKGKGLLGVDNVMEGDDVVVL
jgi:hypothetical protein